VRPCHAPGGLTPLSSGYIPRQFFADHHFRENAMSAKTLLILSSLALLTACAAPDSGPVVVGETKAEDMVCSFEAPTGTNRKVKRCMSREDYKNAMETAQRTAGEIRMPPPDAR
jgi:hypothetical protein